MEIRGLDPPGIPAARALAREVYDEFVAPGYPPRR